MTLQPDEPTYISPSHLRFPDDYCGCIDCEAKRIGRVSPLTPRDAAAVGPSVMSPTSQTSETPETPPAPPRWADQIMHDLRAARLEELGYFAERAAIQRRNLELLALESANRGRQADLYAEMDALIAQGLPKGERPT